MIQGTLHPIFWLVIILWQMFQVIQQMMVGFGRHPALYDLESMYGMLACRGLKCPPWRSKKYRGGSRQADNAFCRNQVIMKAIESDAHTVESLQALVIDKFPNMQPHSLQMKWLVKHLRKINKRKNIELE